MSMSLRLLAVSAAFAFAGVAFAAAPQASDAASATKPHSAQQQRMIACNKQATADCVTGDASSPAAAALSRS